MSHQLTFADSEFHGKRRKTRKEIFLVRMEAVLPWSRMLAVIDPVYPKAGNGRRPYPLDTMRLFAKLSLDQAIPDRTTIMNFRHLLEQHQLARQLLDAINQWLCDAGIMMKQGTLLDATIIEAPTPPKTSVESVTPRCIKPRKAISGISA